MLHCSMKTKKAATEQLLLLERVEAILIAVASYLLLLL